MANLTGSAAGSRQGVSLLASMQTKLTLLVIAPAMILGTVAICAKQYASDASETAIEGIIHSSMRSADLSATAQRVRTSVGQFKDGLVSLTNQHQQDLLSSRKPSGGQQMADLKNRAAALSSLLEQELPSLREAMPGSEEKAATEAETSAMFDRRYNFVLRNARNVLRILDIYLASHERTVALLDNGSFDRARANYVFEENARSKAVGNTVNSLASVLDELTHDVALLAASDMDVTVDNAKRATASASSIVNWSVVAVVLALGVLALLFINASVNRPMARMTKAMRRLADGDLEVEIEKSGRRDEFDEMAAALDVFRDNALAAKGLQDEKAAKAEKEALQSDEKRKHDEALGAEIVALVEKVTGGDFSERLSIEGRSGILAQICQRINELVDGLDAIISDVGENIETLADGDLSRRINKNYGGTFGILKVNVNRMADQLAGTVAQIQSATNQVQNVAAEISSGTEDLSNRTEQAASSLEETAASTEEMAATVKQNADSARNASELAGSADQSAKTGGDVVEQAVSAMTQIQQSAHRITDIISVIDEIAFQTNLLALNASVEAARAGEAGKGFAVVAQEVRQLAQRSAQAATDIKTLIQESNGQVQEGVELVNRAGEALAEIVGSIGKVADIVQEISNASQEQAAGVQEINQSITRMDEMTQQNSALVEQSSASARSLSDQAGTLTGLLAFFGPGNGEAMPVSNTEPVQAPNRSARPARRPAPASSADDSWDEF